MRRLIPDRYVLRNGRVRGNAYSILFRKSYAVADDTRLRPSHAAQILISFNCPLKVSYTRRKIRISGKRAALRGKRSHRPKLRKGAMTMPNIIPEYPQYPPYPPLRDECGAYTKAAAAAAILTAVLIAASMFSGAARRFPICA